MKEFFSLESDKPVNLEKLFIRKGQPFSKYEREGDSINVEGTLYYAYIYEADGRKNLALNPRSVNTVDEKFKVRFFRLSQNDNQNSYLFTDILNGIIDPDNDSPEKLEWYRGYISYLSSKHLNFFKKQRKPIF